MLPRFIAGPVDNDRRISDSCDARSGKVRPMRLDPVAMLLLVLAIGAVLGILVERFAGRGRILRSITRASPVTAALVGIAGAFIGFHLAEILRFPAIPVRLIAAALGAAAIAWVWRAMR
jgi:hypothetical protein